MQAPWRDRRGAVSVAKGTALGLSVVPALSMVVDWRTGAYGPLPAIGFVYWSGIWATAALLATLAVTPLRHVLQAPRLVDLRRILGLAALAYALVHVAAFGLLFRWNGAVLAAQLKRPTIMVASVSLLVLTALGSTSTDGAARWLGGSAWRRLHSLVYAAGVLAIVHFLLSPGIFGAQYLAAGLLAWLLAWRWLPRGSGAGVPARLAWLAVAATVCTFGLEVAWLWLYQAMPPGESLPIVLAWDEDLGVWWQVLLAGAAVWGLAVVRNRREARLADTGKQAPRTP